MGSGGDGDGFTVMADFDDLFARLAACLPLEQRPWAQPRGVGEFPEAAVLVALTSERVPRVLLGRRALHLKRHPGEVAFAGGKRDDGDDSPWATACREALEEVALDPALVRPLGEMDPLVTRTGFRVYPCVATVPAHLDLVVDPSEFDSVFLPALETFARREYYRLEPMHDGQRTRMVPHYELAGDTIWGVTAAVLAQLANVAYDAGLDLRRDWKEQP